MLDNPDWLPYDEKRERLEKLARTIAEVKRRIARRIQSRRGWYDEHGVRQGGLIAFVRHFWKVLEPETKLVDGWPLWAMCEHLEAVTAGEITRLLMNVPPGFMKSLLTDVFWPAWEWGPMGMAHLRYVAFSYASTLTERDNERFRDLVCCDEYRAMYSKVHVARGLRSGVTKISNSRRGWKFASSVGGVGTGERGDRIVCFPGDQMVATAQGPVAIGEIVHQRMDVPVWSLNRKTGELELRPIVGWHTNPGRRLLRITTSDGRSVTCTEDHRIYTAVGDVPASRLEIGDLLLAAPRGVGVTSSVVVGTQVQVKVSPYTTGAYAANGRHADAELGCKHSGGVVVACRNLAHNVFGKMGRAIAKIAVLLAVGNVLGSRSIFEVIQAWIASVAVHVANFLALGARPNECFGYKLMAEPVSGLAVDPQRYARVSLVHGPGHEFSGHGQQCAAKSRAPSAGGSLDKAGPTADSPQVADFVQPRRADDWTPLLVRVKSVQEVHDIPEATYCLTVAHNNNMVIGDEDSNIICSNCDDPHNIKDGESEIIRTETVRWFREAMSNRLNDQRRGAIVIIMQRVHADDVSGAILDNNLDYVHLMIPMEYDWERQTDQDGNPIATEIGWVDPRHVPFSEGGPDECDGALAWPDRFDSETVRRTCRDIGPYGWAGQYCQAPAPRGGGIFKRAWWQLWDSVDGRFPEVEYVLASLDSAFTEKETNDPSALTVWGVFRERESGQKRIILLHAWRKFLEFSGPRLEHLPHESDSMHRLRTREKWGLIEWVADTCNRFKVDLLLIEAKASGMSAGQELQNRYQRRDWAVSLCPVKGDKFSRALRVQSLFSQLMIYAPNREWAEMIIEEMEVFPKGKYRDLTDSTSQALQHLRDAGLLQLDEEVRYDEHEGVKRRKPPQLPYAV